MELNGAIYTFSKGTRRMLVCFVLCLSFGYFTGFNFLAKSTHLSPAGVEKNFNGNEKDEHAGEMIFKKTETEILTIIHTHVLSMSLIFLALGTLVLMTSLPAGLKTFLVTEPFVSIALTFGGIWFIWKDIHWFRYVVMVSGILLNLSFISAVSILLWQLTFPRK